MKVLMWIVSCIFYYVGDFLFKQEYVTGICLYAGYNWCMCKSSDIDDKYGLEEGKT